MADITSCKMCCLINLPLKMQIDMFKTIIHWNEKSTENTRSSFNIFIELA